MYKSTITLIGFILFFNVSAQEVQKFNYQLNFGTSVSIPFKSQVENIWSNDGKPFTYFKSDIGYFAELMISYNFNKRMLLNTGISYINGSLQSNISSGAFEQDATIHTNYLGIPVMFDYQILKNKPLRVGLGCYINFLVNAKEKGTRYTDTTGFYIYYPDPVLQSIEPEEEYNTNVTEHFNLLDFGLIAKVEYEFKLTEKIALLVFSRFNYGLIEIRERTNWVEKWKNYNFLFGVGLKI